MNEPIANRTHSEYSADMTTVETLPVDETTFPVTRRHLDDATECKHDHCERDIYLAGYITAPDDGDR